MAFKVFKQQGKEIIINLDQIVFVKADEVSKKTVIYSTAHTNEIDATLEEIKTLLGVAPKKEIRGF